MSISEPARIRALPRDKHSRPVPWFVAWIGGQPDFRIIRRGGIRDAVTGSLCWICGRPRQPRSMSAFVIGPMCAINRVAPEPPSHVDCAVYAAKACPFLANPAMVRRDRNLPDGMVAPGGVSIPRNPGVALVWHTRRWTVEDVGNGLLWFLGDPEQVGWYAHGRDATRAEVLASIESGLPILRAEAERDGEAGTAELERQTAAAMPLLPRT